MFGNTAERKLWLRSAFAFAHVDLSHCSADTRYSRKCCDQVSASSKHSLVTSELTWTVMTRETLHTEILGRMSATSGPRQMLRAATWENVPSNMYTQRRHSHLRSLFKCFLVRIKHSWLSKMRPVKILIRLRESAGWSVFSLAQLSEGTFSNVAVSMSAKPDSRGHHVGGVNYNEYPRWYKNEPNTAIQNP